MAWEEMALLTAATSSIGGLLDDWRLEVICGSGLDGVGVDVASPTAAVRGAADFVWDVRLLACHLDCCSIASHSCQIENDVSYSRCGSSSSKSTEGRSWVDVGKEKTAEGTMEENFSA